MKSLCIVLALFGQFQLEELQVTEAHVNSSDSVFLQEELAIPIPKIKASEETRPVFDLLGANWCSGCNALKRSLAALDPKTLPFIVRHHNVDSKGWLGATSIPAWSYNGRVFQYGFSTPENLMGNLRKATQPKVAKQNVKTVQRLSPAQLKVFAHSYHGPDVGVVGNNFWYHLQEGNHGFSASQLVGLSQWECAKIHGAHHNGYLTPFLIGGK